MRQFLKIIFVINIFSVFNLNAQDAQFSQYFNNPLYLNPALTGATKAGRLNLGYRSQWPKVTALKTQFVSADYFIPLVNHNTAFGLGTYLLKDEAGRNLTLTNTNINFTGSIEKQIWGNWRIRGGIQYGLFTRKIGSEISQLDFEDELLSGGTTMEDIQGILGERRTFSDISVGTVLSSHKNWIGIAAHHLNTPDQSITNTTYSDNIQQLSTRWTIHGGWEITNVDFGFTGPAKSATIEAMYMHQGNNEQLIAGFKYSHGWIMGKGANARSSARYDEIGLSSAADFTLSTGIWVRGIPLFSKLDDPMVSIDAISFHFGVEIETIESITIGIGYSYDHNVSSLKVSGAQEITLSIRTKQFFQMLNDCKKPMKWSERRKHAINRAYL